MLLLGGGIAFGAKAIVTLKAVAVRQNKRIMPMMSLSLSRWVHPAGSLLSSVTAAAAWLLLV